MNNINLNTNYEKLENIKINIDNNNSNDIDNDNKNENNKFLNKITINYDIFIIILLYLDEDTIGYFIRVCKDLSLIIPTENLFKNICHRIYPIQLKISYHQLKLKKYSKWKDMFIHRYRIRYNGFYYLKISLVIFYQL